MLTEIGGSRAENDVDSAKSAAFDNRIFAGPLAEKTRAWLVRRYDADHLAQHPKQKVSAMKPLLTAENVPEEKTTNYSFALGIKYVVAPAISIPAAFAAMFSQRTRPATSVSAATSIVKVTAPM
jgi:hypothetical protein